ncbi:MAG: CYTH domain-containing protein [Sedimentisphaerales bacterium]|nr:CYTH domain-containing protein [Sedimentisphaerales bacterium]
MAKEIERKFLVKDDVYHRLAKPILYRQGYIATDKDRIVRVRTKQDKATLTVKGPTNVITRTEYEYEIPMADAEHILMELCKKPIIEKYRYKFIIDGLSWSVDEFTGENEGLVVAEVNLTDENQPVNLPDWIGDEVSDKPEYSNSSLVNKPYSSWK